MTWKKPNLKSLHSMPWHAVATAKRFQVDYRNLQVALTQLRMLGSASGPQWECSPASFMSASDPAQVTSEPQFNAQVETVYHVSSYCFLFRAHDSCGDLQIRRSNMEIFESNNMFFQLFAPNELVCAFDFCDGRHMRTFNIDFFTCDKCIPVLFHHANGNSTRPAPHELLHVFDFWDTQRMRTSTWTSRNLTTCNSSQYSTM